MPDNNALHVAVRGGNIAEVQALVGKFDINAKGSDGSTALCYAAWKGHVEVVKLLLTLNPSPDVNLADVSTPTMTSVHLICNFLSHISMLYPTYYPPRQLLLSLVVEVPPSTTLLF